MVATATRWKVGVGAVALVAGAIAVGVAMAKPGDDDRVLVVDAAGAVSLLEPVSSAAAYTVSEAVPTHDRSALLTTRAGASGTVLETRDPQTGEVTGSTPLDQRDLVVRTVSPRNGAVALMPGPRPEGLYTPTPRTSTTITVAYLDDRPARTYVFEGNLEPEMFSLDETKLFVLEFVPADAPTGYVVRVVDLATAAVTDTESPQVELNPQMRGRARAQALHPDGTFLYTLYTVAEGNDRSAFVHVINLDEEWSFCVFLPAPVGTVNEATVGMGLAPDGSTLYVADAATSAIARVDTAALTVADVAIVSGFPDSGVAPSVAIADDAVYLGSTNQITELQAAGFSLVAAWSHTTAVTGLSVSEAGDVLRIAGGGRITLLDRVTRSEVGVLRAPSGTEVQLLGPPAGSVTQIPLECAC